MSDIIEKDMKNEYLDIIARYINAYNTFDIDGMLSYIDDDIRFENISNGEVTLATNGIAELRDQALKAKRFWSEREQKITHIEYKADRVEVDIDYRGVLAVDVLNGMNAGSEIILKGRSIFKFKEGKIIELKDITS
jgi:hypothetical protein